MSPHPADFRNTRSLCSLPSTAFLGPTKSDLMSFSMIMNQIFWLGTLGTAAASPLATTKRAVTPSVKSAQIIGDVSNPGINRDSCGSARIGDRMLWTCRDSQNVVNGQGTLPIWSSSAAWTNIGSDGTPATMMYAEDNQQPFYPIPPDECSGNTAGECGNGWRWAIWPDSPPMVVSGDQADFTAYTWIKNAAVSNSLQSSNDPDPKTALYKVTGNVNEGDRNAPPVATMVDEGFYADNQVAYGNYGNFVKDGTAYLFAHTSQKNVFVAKVPVGSVEDKSQYQYWVNGAWTNTPASLDDSSSNLVNSNAGGQGTYYFSEKWNSWVWIGQGAFPSADFFITTAPDVTGPWQQPTVFYSGANGNSNIPSYTLQAHPGMSDPAGSDIYISYTMANTDLYHTPLIHVTWN